MTDAPGSMDHPYSLVRSPDGVTGYVSGVLPYAEDGTLERDPTVAAARVLRVLRERLEAAGFSLQDVVKTTVFVTDMGWRPAVNAAYHDAFVDPRPARTMVEVSRLPSDSPIEIEAIVHHGAQG